MEDERKRAGKTEKGTFRIGDFRAKTMLCVNMRYRRSEIKGTEAGRTEGQREQWRRQNGSGDYVNC